MQLLCKAELKAMKVATIAVLANWNKKVKKDMKDCWKFVRIQHWSSGK